MSSSRRSLRINYHAERHTTLTPRSSPCFRHPCVRNSPQSAASLWFFGFLIPAFAGLAFLAPARAGGLDRAVDAVLPRVVKLYGLGVGSQAGFGSGVLVSPDGLVLTVLSLLIDSENIRAVTSDGTVYGADAVFRDPVRQLALLRLKAGPGTAVGGEGNAGTGRTIGPFPYFDVGCPESAADSPTGDGAPNCLASLKPGDWVVAAGNAFKVADGTESVSVFRGVFSTRTPLDARRRVKDFPYHGDVLVIDAITSNPGAPGSAVVDLEGRFIGMVGRVVISNRTHTHFNYAVPRDVLAEFVREAASPDATTTSRPSRRSTRDAEAVAVDVGIRVARTGYRDLPPFVERVRSGSPAERAGVQKDDLILTVNNTNVGDVREFDARWAMLRPGEPIDLVIRRGRRILDVHIAPEKNP